MAIPRAQDPLLALLCVLAALPAAPARAQPVTRTPRASEQASQHLTRATESYNQAA